MAFLQNENIHYGPIPMEIDNDTIMYKPKARKATIPKKLKTDVWDFYIGEELGIALCMCCNKEKIKATHFECGHVISEFNGGTICIENLRPICSQCNRSVGRKNMNEFMRNYSYLYPPNWIGKKCKLSKIEEKLETYSSGQVSKTKNTHNKPNTIEVIVIE